MDPAVKSLVLELLETIEDRVKERLFKEFLLKSTPDDEIRAEMSAATRVVEELRRMVAE